MSDLHEESASVEGKSLNFLEEIVEESIAGGEKRVQTRFPPNRTVICISGMRKAFA